MENSNNNKRKSRLMYVLSGMHMAERDYNPGVLKYASDQLLI